MNPSLSPRPTQRSECKAWGHTLRTLREAAHLTRMQLAAMAGVADSTIRNLETGRNLPSRLSYQRLLAVPAIQTRSINWASDLWIAPDYDPMALTQQLIALLNDPRGGELDPMHLYLDAASAADWCRATDKTRAKQSLDARVLDDLAYRIRALAAQRPVEIWALGAGEAPPEAALMKRLHARGICAGRLLLFDTSTSLLLSGYRHATHVLADAPSIQVHALAADFRRLSHHKSLFGSRKALRIVTLLGSTFAGLRDEKSLVESCLAPCDAGDLLVLDVVLSANAPTEPPRKTKVPHAIQRFVSGLFFRHVPGLQRVSLRVEQGVEHARLQAELTMHDQTQRTFLVATSKHHTAAVLQQSMQEAGWPMLHRQPFDGKKSSVFLFEKG